MPVIPKKTPSLRQKKSLCHENTGFLVQKLTSADPARVALTCLLIGSIVECVVTYLTTSTISTHLLFLILLHRCCSSFLSPPDFAFENEQKIKVCNECFAKAQIYLKERRLMFKRSIEIQSLACGATSEETKGSLQALLARRAYELSNNALEYLLKEENLYDDWYGIIKALAKEAVEVIQANVTYKDDLNINKHIKVKKIPYEDQSLTQLVGGVVIRKNVVSRKMKVDLENPRILMLEGDLDLAMDELTTVDASSVEDENAFLEDFTNKIAELAPQILIVDGRINRIVHEALLKSGITVVTKMRKSQFKRVAEAMDTEPSKNFAKLKSTDFTMLRDCESFKVLNFENQAYYEKSMSEISPQEGPENIDPSLMFFESCMMKKNVTFLLSGPDIKKLAGVKECLKKFFPIFRNLLLETGIIYQEICLFNPQNRIWKLLAGGNNTINLNTEEDFQQKFTVQNYLLEKKKEITSVTCLLNESTAATAGYMLRYLTERNSMETLLSKINITFSRFTVVPIDFDTIPDLKNINPSLQAKLKRNLKASKCWHRSQMNQLERDCSIIETYFEGQRDVTIGNFLLERYIRAGEKCSTCFRTYQTHINYFINGDVYIKIESDLKNNSELSIACEMGKSFLMSTFKDFIPSLKPKASPNSSPVSKPRGSLSTRVETEKSIKMYLQCSRCLMKLSETVDLNKDFLEYSFTRYLESLIWSAHEHEDFFRQSSTQAFSDDSMFNSLNTTAQTVLLNDLPRRSNVRSCCVSCPKNRVFVVDDFSIKMQVGYSNSYSLSSPSYRDSKSIELFEMAEQALIGQKKLVLKELQKNYLSFLINNIQKYLSEVTDNLGLELATEGLYSVKKPLIDINDKNQDFYNILVSNITLLYKRILIIKEEADKNFEENPKHHLDIDLWRRKFYERLEEMVDIMEVIINTYYSLNATAAETGGRDANNNKSSYYVEFKVQSFAYTSVQAAYFNSSIGGNNKFQRTSVFKKSLIKDNKRGLNSAKVDEHMQGLEEELVLIDKLVTGIFTTYDNFETPENINYVTCLS